MITAKTLPLALLMVLTAPFVTQALAQAPGQPVPTATSVFSAAATDKSNGEVRKIDKEGRKITLKHGEIKNLGMPGMTMVFKVRDATLLDKAQVGSKVKFVAASADGEIFVTAIEAAK